MLKGLKTVVVLPAYNAASTLESTYREIPFDIVDEVILTDDYSRDDTLQVARQIGIRHIITHENNKGYGANQKSCYDYALSLGADIIVMVHPDYQYTPRLIRAMASVIAEGVYPVVLGSRILGLGALRGGMPLYKYFFNRVLTLLQNIIMGSKLSEFHTGYRAYSAYALRLINYRENSDDFVFDNQVLAQLIFQKQGICEITCPTRYDDQSSSISFVRSVKYGWGCLCTAFLYRMACLKIYQSRIFRPLK